MNPPWSDEGKVAECAKGAEGHRELCQEKILSPPGTQGDEGPRLQIYSQTSRWQGR